MLPLIYIYIYYNKLIHFRLAITGILVNTPIKKASADGTQHRNIIYILLPASEDIEPTVIAAVI